MMLNRVFFIVLLLAFSGIAGAEVISLNGGWEFQRLNREQSKGAIRNQGSEWESQFNITHVATSSPLRVAEDTLMRERALLQQGKWESVRLPHTPHVEDLTVLHQWQGVCYYKKQLKALPEWADKTLWLEFEGAMSLADVWVNGRHVIQHAGGYLPFVIDLTDVLKQGEGNEILVRLDNRDHGLIPPGKPLNMLDFCYYGGLYRGVNLFVKSRRHITHSILSDELAGGGIFVRYPAVGRERAEVLVQTQVANMAAQAGELTLRYTLQEIDGLWGKGKPGRKVVSEEVAGGRWGVGEKRHVETTLTVVHPRLWSPDAPNLYALRVEVIDGGRVVDAETLRIGIRRFDMTKEKGLLLNGEPLRLVGSNRHMEYPYVGNALPDNAQYRDIHQIRMNGFNVVRLGHYPQAPSVLKACDELGLLAIDPIPGWQYFNKDSVFIRYTFRDIRDMIRRDRNHPSVLLWEVILNESWPPVSWKDKAVKIAHEEYPGDQCFASGDTYGYTGYDVSYNDWEDGYRRPNNSPNLGFIREYYDYEFGGHYSTTRITRGDGELALLQNAWNAQWSHNRYRTLYPGTMGDAVWSMYDYNRGCCDNICYSGVADLFRLPKYSLAFFASQMAPGSPQPEGVKAAEVFIASAWEAWTSDTLVIFGNVDEVELLVNGRVVKRQEKDNGGDTDYTAGHDGGNCCNLAFPPFTFTGVKWEKGTVKAIGYIRGRKVAESMIRTPEEPSVLEIGYFKSGRAAAKNDLLIVYVRLKDANGTLVPRNGIPVDLQVEGGKVMGPQRYDTEAGVASFVVATEMAGRLTVNAVGGGLQARKSIRLEK